MLKRLFPVILILVLLTACGYSQEDLDAAYDNGFDAGYAAAESNASDSHENCIGYSNGFEDGQAAQFDEMYEEFFNERYWDGYDAGYYDAENGYEYDNIDVDWDNADSY